jgi:hypothetical protein
MMAVSSAKVATLVLSGCGRSLVYIRYKTGPNFLRHSGLNGFESGVLILLFDSEVAIREIRLWYLAVFGGELKFVKEPVVPNFMECLSHIQENRGVDLLLL